MVNCGFDWEKGQRVKKKAAARRGYKSRPARVFSYAAAKLRGEPLWFKVEDHPKDFLLHVLLVEEYGYRSL